MLSARCDRRAGVTLVEILIVILIVGLTAGLATLAMTALRPPAEDDLSNRVRATRARAIREGRSITVVIDATSAEAPPALMRFRPDGSVLGAGLDPWTGSMPRPHAPGGR